VPTRLSQACLAHDAETGARATVTCKVDGHTYNLCTLEAGRTDSQTLDLMYGADVPVSFSVIGDATVHLSGYVMVDEEPEEDHGMYLSEEQLEDLRERGLLDDDDILDSDEEIEEMDEETRANTLMNAMFSG